MIEEVPAAQTSLLKKEKHGNDDGLEVQAQAGNDSTTILEINPQNVIYGSLCSNREVKRV